jgi:hypothetical protein
MEHMTVAPAPVALLPVPQVLPPVLDDVARHTGGRPIVWLKQVVAPVLGPGQALALGRYRPHYHSSLGRWVVARWCLLVGLFEFKFDHLNTNSTI